MPVNFAERRKEAEKAGLLSSGDYLKLKEGDNRLRLMSECLPHQDVYNGTKTFKWLCYVIDRKDGKVKPFFMPHMIYKYIEALQFSEDYTFADVPMPYDLTIHAVNAGSKEVKYSLIPAKKETPITALEHQQLQAVKPLKDLQQALYDKKKKDVEPLDDDDDHQLSEEEIPFAR